jgi:hypothetical protein
VSFSQCLDEGRPLANLVNVTGGYDAHGVRRRDREPVS